MDKAEIGKRVKIARKVYETISEEKMTQEILAEKAGVSRGYIGDIESGRTFPTISALLEISKALNIPVEYFISEEFSLQTYLFKKQHKSLDIRVSRLPEDKQRIIESLVQTFENDETLATAEGK